MTSTAVCSAAAHLIKDGEPIPEASALTAASVDVAAYAARRTPSARISIPAPVGGWDNTW